MQAARLFSLKPTLLTCIASISLMSVPVHAELILSGTPNMADHAELEKRYTLLASELSQALGEPVRYVAPKNEMAYAQDIRQGKYDILLDGPQFAAWRMAKGMHTPVVQSDTSLTFVVVVPVSDTSTQSTGQLIGKPVCLMPAPNLSNLMFMNIYPNPLQLPVTKVVDGYRPIVEKVIKGECVAGVISASVFNDLDKGVIDKLRVFYNTPPLPGYFLTASKKLDASKRDALAKRLADANPAADKLAQAMTAAVVRGADPTKTGWKSAKTDSIKGLDQILIQQSFGWE